MWISCKENMNSVLKLGPHPQDIAQFSKSEEKEEEERRRRKEGGGEGKEEEERRKDPQTNP